MTTFDGHPWNWAAHEQGERTPRKNEGSRWNAGKDLSFVPLRPERVVEVRYDYMEGVRFRHTAQFVRWRPDREPAVVHLRAARTAGRVPPRRRPHRRLTPARTHPGRPRTPPARHLCASRARARLCASVARCPARPAPSWRPPGAPPCPTSCPARTTRRARAVLRHQPRPRHRAHRAPLRPARQPVLARAAPLRVHPPPAAARRAGRAARARPGDHEHGRAGDGAGGRADRRRGARGRACGSASSWRGVRPRWLAVVGITAYRVAFDAPRAAVGPQDARWGTPGCGCCRTPAGSTPTGSSPTSRPSSPASAPRLSRSERRKHVRPDVRTWLRQRVRSGVEVLRLLLGSPGALAGVAVGPLQQLVEQEHRVVDAGVQVAELGEPRRARSRW